MSGPGPALDPTGDDNAHAELPAVDPRSPSTTRDEAGGGRAVVLRAFAIAAAGGALTSVMLATGGWYPGTLALALIVGVACAAAVAISTRPLGWLRLVEGWSGLLGGVLVGGFVAMATRLPGWPPTSDSCCGTPLILGVAVGVLQAVVGTFGYALGALVAWAADRIGRRAHPPLGEAPDGAAGDTDDHPRS